MSQFPQTVEALSDLSKIAAAIDDEGWRPALGGLPMKTLRTVYQFCREVGFNGGAKDPSNLVDALAAEIADRERRQARRTKLARRRERQDQP